MRSRKVATARHCRRGLARAYPVVRDGQPAGARKQSGLAAQIVSELSNKKHKHFVDKLLLADVCASLEHAADVLGRKSRQSAENASAPTVRGSQA
jgi:hypothetical protein